MYLKTRGVTESGLGGKHKNGGQRGKLRGKQPVPDGF